MKIDIKSWLKKTFEPFMDPSGKETPESHADERIRQAAKHLPESIKAMSVPELARVINKMNTPNKWNITKTMASGKIKKHGPASGLGIIHDDNTESMRNKRLKKIAKGIIQVTVDKPYKSSKKPVVKQEASNEGDGKIL